MINLVNIRCVVVDDEPLAIDLISDHIKKCPELLLAYSTTSPIEAIEWIKNNPIDLVFLDINMPGMSGIEFLKLIAGKCNSVLVTAYQHYAIEGYEYDVIDYLLKPVTLERFKTSIKKFTSRFFLPQMKTPEPTKDPDIIFVRSEYKIIKINLNDVIYLEGLRDYVAIHTVKDKMLTLQHMHAFESELPKLKFIRIHKSYIISLDKIKFIEKSRIVMNNDIRLPIGETYKASVIKMLGPI